MEVFEQIVSTLETYIWNFPEPVAFIVILLLGTGVFLTIRLKFIQLRRLDLGELDEAEKMGAEILHLAEKLRGHRFDRPLTRTRQFLEAYRAAVYKGPMAEDGSEPPVSAM
jgi:hypothetical protein